MRSLRCGVSTWPSAPTTAPTACPAGSSSESGIARALAQRPQVILADEPVASLDPKTARVVLDDLRRAAHELGIAVLCNLHQVEYALEFADRIVGIMRRTCGV